LDDLQQREDRWAIVDLMGKAGHIQEQNNPVTETGCGDLRD
jgi:hypothetical protein